MKPELKAKLKYPAKLILIGGVALLTIGFAYQFLSPRVYRSAAKVQVSRRGWVQTEKSGAHSAASFETPFIVAEYDFMRSDDFLSQVIKNLDLRASWGKRSQQGAPLSTNEALVLLHTKTRIGTVPHTSVLEVEVTSDDAAETASIANEIARLYRDYRQSRRHDASSDKIVAMQTQWQEQGKKVSEARERLAQVVLDIQKARAASTNSFYDPDSLEAMQTKRVELETDYVKQQSALASLKTLKPEQLRLALPGMVTNSTLSSSLEQLEAAERQLTEAKTTRGPDTPEMKYATIMVQELDKRLTQVIGGVMIEREADLALRKSLLDKLNRELLHASTNVNEFSTNNPVYLAVLQKVQSLEEEREVLRTRLDTDSLEAVSPLSLSAEIVQTAEPPVRPASPDERLAFGIIITGGAAAILGLLLLVLASKTSKPALEQIQLSRPPA
ncbi:MAG: ywqD 2 [Pedosphaera sp.]|nr:ywqD 2 [Pedosphaera sp.]